MGLSAGIFFWFFPQIGYVGWRPFLQNGLSFSHGHFTDWGGSVMTFGGVERIVCLIKSAWVCGLGGWWYDTSFMRLIHSLIMIISFLCFLKHCQFGRRWLFPGLYVIPYLFWVILGQNVANPRHIMPLVPMILIVIAYGLYKVREDGYKGVSLFLTMVLIASVSVTSFKLVAKYHNNIPAPIQVIQFIERRFNNISTRIYCCNEKRFFDYYAPHWDVRTAENMADLNIDMKSSLGKPQNILLVHTSEEINRSGVIPSLLTKFEGNPYTDSTREGLLLYALTGL